MTPPDRNADACLRVRAPVPRVLEALAVAALLLLSAPPAAADDVLESARAAAAAGDHAGAIARLDARLAEHPDDRDARFLRAQVLAWSGDFQASRAAYDELLATEPGNVDCLFGRAQAALWDGEPALALEDLRAARALAPDYASLDDLERQAHAALAAARTAAEPPPRPRELIVQTGWEDLDRGFDDWTSVSVAARGGVASNAELRASAAYVSRYGQSDVDASLGATWVAGPLLEIGGDLGAAANADYLPEWSGRAHAVMRLAPATLLQVAYRHARYAATQNDTWSVTAEQYVERFRLAYTLYHGDPADAQETYSHVMRLDWSYSDSGWAGVQYVTGEESESDGAGGLLVTKVEGAALLGRHALTPEWSLLWALTWHDQGDLYRRAGLDVGLARRF